MNGDVAASDRRPGRTTATSQRPAAPAHRGEEGSISVRHLWKIFGPGAAKHVGSALTRAELRDRHGCLVAVRDVGFTVAPGEVFVVMGLSGSGKSTLVRCLTRLIEPTGGEVHIGGGEVTGMGRRALLHLRRHEVAMVFQHFGLLPHRRVIDNIAYGLEIQGVPRAERRARAGEVLSLVGLDGYADNYPDQLSGGMQQRVGLARALATDPGVLLFDEPFSALDPLIRRDMQAEVTRLHAEVGKTMVFITHDLSEALKLGDRIAVMRDGELVQVGTPEDLVGAPADAYVADFVRDVARADVLTCRWIARPPTPDEPLDGPSVPGTLLIRDAIGTVLRAGQPILVTDGDTLLGVIDRDVILAVLAGTAAAAAPRLPAFGDGPITAGEPATPGGAAERATGGAGAEPATGGGAAEGGTGAPAGKSAEAVA